MLFSGWLGVLRVLIVGVAAYFSLILLLRLSGKRTLSKMNAFDFVVTVALGSTLATILLSKDTALIEGITAFAVLIGLQFIIAWLAVRSAWIRRVVKGEPTLLFYRGQFAESALYAERVTKEEVYAAIREQGFPRLEDVEAVVLETDGSFSALQNTDKNATALATVHSVGNINSS